MPDSANKLSRFWQELKRRNVTHVLAVYIAAGFMILELVDMISEPFGLPAWSFKLALFILIGGLFITLIISWIFDVTPKGVEKTKPSSELKEGEKRVVSNSWRIATYVSVVVIIGLILLNIFNLNKVSESLTQYGKSIAVLPFINDTQDKENDQFISGTMESILNNLSKIEDLRVVSRTSVEQYRDTNITIPEVAEKQRVSYILEGSMQKYGGHIRITLQIIDQYDKHLWSEEFIREIKPDQGEEYFAFMSEIAQKVAKKLEAVITPEEEERIEKTPTTSLTAHTFYQRGWDIYEEYRRERKDTTKLNTAEALYYEALESDSTYAPAFVGLAYVVWDSDWKFTSNRNQMDSVLSLANKALSYDDQLAEAYSLRGAYYAWTTREREKALKEFNLALKFNPNHWRTLRSLASYYQSTDLPKALEYLHEAIWRNQGLEYTDKILANLIFMYRMAGFFDKAEYYSQQKLKLNRDSAEYYASLTWIECDRGNWDKVIEICNKRLAIDSTDMDALGNMGAAYLLLEEYKKSLIYFEKLIDKMNASGKMQYVFWQWIGYAYWKSGDLEMADYYFKQTFENAKKGIEIWSIPDAWFFRASVYAFQGMKEEALKDLWVYYELEGIHFYNLTWIKNYPFFDNIRDDPEFQQILHSMEAKCQAEHERVRQWLEKNDML